jgi:curved DNA-binding protein CbpA
MTKENALIILNLPSSANREEIDQAYQRLTRRYPPEFHPEKFRAIDEAYRFLTSIAFRIERLLSPQTKRDLDRKTFSFDLTPPVSSLEGALSEIRKQMKIAFLWSPLEKENHHS